MILRKSIKGIVRRNGNNRDNRKNSRKHRIVRSSLNGNNRESTITDAEIATFMAEMLEDYTAKRLLAEGGHRASPLVRDMIADYRIRAKIKE